MSLSFCRPETRMSKKRPQTRQQKSQAGFQWPLPCIPRTMTACQRGQSSEPGHCVHPPSAVPLATSPPGDFRGGDGGGAIASSCRGRDYQFRYDDGLSARLGVHRIPLVMRQHCKDGIFTFKNPPHALEKPLRTQRQTPQRWWPPVRECVMMPRQIPRPRYIGVFCDPTRCPPNETILKNF